VKERLFSILSHRYRFSHTFPERNITRSPKAIPLANPFQRSPCGGRGEETEDDQMEERSRSLFALQRELKGMGLLDRLSKMEHLLSGDIADALRAWLGLHFFEDSPAVSKACQNHV